MTRRTKTDEPHVTDVYLDTPSAGDQQEEYLQKVAVTTGEFKIPSFTLFTDTKRIDVYGIDGEVTTASQIQYTNIFGKLAAGKYQHNNTEVDVSDR